MSEQYIQNGEYVRSEYAVEQLLGAADDAIEVVAQLVDGWLEGREPELIMAIRALKKRDFSGD